MSVHWLLVVAAYLLGSIPFGLLIVKALGGDDIRSTGSGNIGAANVARNAGWLAGMLTLLLDAGKGYLAVWIAGHYTHGSGKWMIAAAVAAVAGHIFPVWLGFKGGKGVATEPRSFSADLRRSSGGCGSSLVAGGLVLALFVAGFHCGGGVTACAGVPVLCAAARAADLYAGRHGRRLAAGSCEASSQYTSA